jgi:hypothetical protein
VKRRIQNLRKVAGLVEKDKINVFISTEKELEGIVKKKAGLLSDIVNAEKISFEPAKGEMEETEIDGRSVKIKIEKVKK